MKRLGETRDDRFGSWPCDFSHSQGQKAKYSLRADIFRCCPDNRHAVNAPHDRSVPRRPRSLFDDLIGAAGQQRHRDAEAIAEAVQARRRAQRAPPTCPIPGSWRKPLPATSPGSRLKSDIARLRGGPMIRRRMLIGGALVTLISFRATKTAQPKKLRDIGFVEGRK